MACPKPLYQENFKLRMLREHLPCNSKHGPPDWQPQHHSSVCVCFGCVGPVARGIVVAAVRVGCSLLQCMGLSLQVGSRCGARALGCRLQ